MTYQDALDYLFNQFASYQKEGATAYKKDLNNITQLCNVLGNPQNSFQSIHIGGTNGKGSTTHLLTSTFIEAGYKVGTYTSPHYFDFRERILIHGQLISKSVVIEFVEKIQTEQLAFQPSFFELTVAMAFWCFQQEAIDIAIIEVGLGGRLDATNIIQPMCSIITNISLDHQLFLGNTIEEIAAEKAGIIKTNTPIIIGETKPELQAIFEQYAAEKNAQIFYASEQLRIQAKPVNFETKQRQIQLFTADQKFITTFNSSLLGDYQLHNIKTAFACFDLIKHQFNLQLQHFKNGVSNLKTNTIFIGRWEILHNNPLVIADSAHNEEGISVLFKQIQQLTYNKLHIIYGCVSDKDAGKIINQFPKRSTLYLTQPSIPRAMNVDDLASIASNYFEEYESFLSVEDAYNFALKSAIKDDIIVIVGSIFLIADLEELY